VSGPEQPVAKSLDDADLLVLGLGTSAAPARTTRRRRTIPRTRSCVARSTARRSRVRPRATGGPCRSARRRVRRGRLRSVLRRRPACSPRGLRNIPW
jgi:hypothetical protein